MKCIPLILAISMSLLTPVILHTCRMSEFSCHNNKCISSDKYCNTVNDCDDNSDEPKFCTVCNRTYYGDVDNTYRLALQKPSERKLPFLCHLTFTANGNNFGDIVQLGFENFSVGRLEQSTEQCPDGYMQLLELGRPFSGGSWCGRSAGLAMYYSESSTITITLRLFYTGRYTATPFEFRIRYRYLRREEAITRYGKMGLIERGELMPGTYCGRNFYECHRRKCQIQSPNYPGLYPRNATCSYQVRQKNVPKCKHGMILVRQSNRHKIKFKRGTMAYTDKAENGIKVWADCQDSMDQIIFHDGLTIEEPVLLKFCGGDWLPPVISRGPQMLVVFHSSAVSTPLQTEVGRSLMKGFELDVDTVFADSDSYDFSRDKIKCDFLINASESESTNGLAIKSKNRFGAVSSPRHTLPPNSNCTYRFEGRTADHVWLAIASYWHEPLLYGQSEPCPTRLRIWDGGGKMLGDHCNRPKICDHAALRNHSHTRPCTMEESYVSDTNNVVMQYFSKQGTAVHPSKFLVRYEFVDTELGGANWTQLEDEDRKVFESCSRVFRAPRGNITSPRNVFMFRRGGAQQLACLYRIEASAGEKIRLTLRNVSFGVNGNCRNDVDPYTGQYTCRHLQYHTELEVAELPWRDVRIQRACFCDNGTLLKMQNGYVLETTTRVVEIRFKVFYLNSSEDFFDVYFAAEFESIRKADCPRRQRVRGSGGEIQMTYPAHRRVDVQCDGIPWLVEARNNRSLFLLTWGHFLPLKPKSDEPIRCHTKNRILLYSGTPYRLVHVICPSTPYDSQKEIHIFSEEWYAATGEKMPYDKPPNFLLRFIGKESGKAVLNWLEITRPRASHLVSITPQLNTSFQLPSYDNLTFHCPYYCPELNACIGSTLWCDGHRNCPSGYDESETHCDLKYKILRNYAIVTLIMVVIIVLTVFVLIAIFKRFRNDHTDVLPPRRITTQETLYDQSSSTVSS